MGEKMNIMLFGESGSGKSSAVNLLLGRQAAKVSDLAVGCTFQFENYEGENYNLFDTVGLSEGKKGTIDQSHAVKQLINLLKSLEDGVSLLVFVMEKGRIKKSLDENYKLFAEAICMKEVPIILLITHCEMEMEQGKWWTENKKYFDKYQMEFNGVVCGCTMDPDSAPPPMREIIKSLNESTVLKLNATIQSQMLIPGWIVKGGWITWVQIVVKNVIRRIFRALGVLTPATWFSGDELEERLYTYFVDQGYCPIVARQMAQDIASAI